MFENVPDTNCHSFGGWLEHVRLTALAMLIQCIAPPAHQTLAITTNVVAIRPAAAAIRSRARVGILVRGPVKAPGRGKAGATGEGRIADRIQIKDLVPGMGRVQISAGIKVGLRLETSDRMTGPIKDNFAGRTAVPIVVHHKVRTTTARMTGTMPARPSACHRRLRLISSR
jgi:hypothetical protein